ncbi:MAG TPA: hypothetical protein VLY63_10645 [Anaerolineae bacterium]|nr:hypothetical protein [Anaerolineae bacterium]
MAEPRARLVRTLAWALIILVAIVIVALAAALLTYPPEYLYRVFAWGETDVFDWQKLPEHRLEAAPAALHFEKVPHERVVTLFAQDYAEYYPDWFSEPLGRECYANMWWGMALNGDSYDFWRKGTKDSTAMSLRAGVGDCAPWYQVRDSVRSLDWVVPPIRQRVLTG